MHIKRPAVTRDI